MRRKLQARRSKPSLGKPLPNAQLLGYEELLNDVKQRTSQSRIRASYFAHTKNASNLAHAARIFGGTNLAQLVPDLDGEQFTQPITGVPWFHGVVAAQELTAPVQHFSLNQETIKHRLGGRHHMGCGIFVSLGVSSGGRP